MIEGYRMADPPPHGEEPPEPREPQWPWWLGLVALVATLGIQLVASIIVVIAAGTTGDDDLPPGGTLALGVIASVSFFAVALIAAKMVKPLHPWQFGLKPTRFWPAFGWTVAALAVFYVAVAIYTQLVGEPEQTTADDIGADESDFLLISAGVLFVFFAPIGEELFFRGLMYGALRNSLSPVRAMLVVGVVFGLLHATSGIEAVPALILLGILFCWIYEKTGSLYPCIALHAFNNALAYIGQTDVAPGIALGMGAVMIAGCIIVPRIAWRTPEPAWSPEPPR
jgi:membrane protease YdiL (CAAX protease family)